MKRLIATASIIFVFNASFSQEKAKELRDKYYNLKGDTEEEALYIEAVKNLKEFDTTTAIENLKNAIIAEVAYSDAYILLARIYEDKGDTKEAFSYYYQAIDQIVEQSKDVYIALFRNAMKLGKYDALKMNMKRFKGLYPNEELPYYMNSLDLVYNYKTWNSSKFITAQIGNNGWNCISKSDNKILGIKNHTLYKAKYKKGVIKSEKTLAKLHPEIKALHLSVSSDGELLFLAGIDIISGKSSIYMLKKEGKKWGIPTQLPKEVNIGEWNSYPYYSTDKKCLYFSSHNNGNKDIFVSKLNEDGSWDKAMALFGLNTEADEIAPYFDSVTNKMYFASNGYAGMGGYDIFITRSYEIIDGIILPSDVKNIGHPVNSHFDDIYFDGDLLIRNNDDTKVIQVK